MSPVNDAPISTSLRDKPVSGMLLSHCAKMPDPILGAFLRLPTCIKHVHHAAQ